MDKDFDLFLKLNSKTIIQCMCGFTTNRIEKYEKHFNEKKHYGVRLT